MRSYLILSGLCAVVIFGALGTVALLASGYGLPLVPFWVAGGLKLGAKLQDMQS